MESVRGVHHRVSAAKQRNTQLQCRLAMYSWCGREASAPCPAERPSEPASGLTALLCATTVLYNFLYISTGATPMDAITYSKARATLAQTIDAVCENHEPVIITKKNDRSVVMLSLEDYQALEETSYLLRNPKNARRLLDSVNELDAGDGIERALAE